jgi:thiamine kinase-like enzyme
MHDLRLAIAEPRIRALPIWSGAVAITPLLGGLSNESYDVRDSAGRFAVRFGRDFPFHHVSREREVMTARAAHEAGFAAEVVHAEPGVMVSRFIEGHAFTEADVRRHIERVGRLVRQFHDTMPLFVRGPGYLFWVFHVIRDYARTLRGTGNPLVGRLPEVLEVAAELERAQTPLPIVFGHNDFLPGNIIDDGRKLWIIDYEYAGFSTGMFDLAGLASNASFSAVEAAELLTAYFGTAPGEDLLRSHAAMSCASLLREALWGLVSEVHMSATGADYAEYARENFARFDAAYALYHSHYTKA